MYYSVCLPAVFSDRPLSEAVYAAHRCGATGCEFWGCKDDEVPAIQKALQETGMRLACTFAPFTDMNDAAKRDTYMETLKHTIEIAKKIGTDAIITQVGLCREGVSHEEQYQLILDTAKQCIPVLEENGITLLVEPLNALVDHKGYFLTSSQEGARLVREAGSKNIRLLFDIYHQQITEGNLIANLTECMDVLGHIHTAGVPGRHEPSRDSEIDYRPVIAELKKLGYNGAIGLEYFPKMEDREASLREQIAYFNI